MTPEEIREVAREMDEYVSNRPPINEDVRRVRDGARAQLQIEKGCAFVLSDQHYRCGFTSVSHRASLELIERLRPFALINNGDTTDAACISRWPVGSYAELGSRQTVKDELEEAFMRLQDYEQFDFVKYRTWNLGNHDARFETRLAEKVPEFSGVDGFTLKDHFPGWLPAWRTDFMDRNGESEVITQHRFKGGMHAGQNNVLWSGTNYVTGHDHMLKAYTISNAKRLLWGVHAGTMAPIDSPLFTNYTEDKVVNWQEGFVILHFAEDRLIGPELVHVERDGRIYFRGEVLRFS